jgi:hypothetical protein
VAALPPTPTTPASVGSRCTDALLSTKLPSVFQSQSPLFWAGF